MQAHCFRDTLTFFSACKQRPLVHLRRQAFVTLHLSPFQGVQCADTLTTCFIVCTAPLKKHKALTSVPTKWKQTHKSLSNPLCFLMCWQQSEEFHAVPHVLRQGLFFFGMGPMYMCLSPPSSYGAHPYLPPQTLPSHLLKTTYMAHV